MPKYSDMQVLSACSGGIGLQNLLILYAHRGVQKAREHGICSAAVGVLNNRSQMIDWYVRMGWHRTINKTQIYAIGETWAGSDIS